MHIMQHYHALDICVLTVITESAVVEAPLWKNHHRSARAEKHAEASKL